MSSRIFGFGAVAAVAATAIYNRQKKEVKACTKAGDVFAASLFNCNGDRGGVFDERRRISEANGIKNNARALTHLLMELSLFGAPPTVVSSQETKFSLLKNRYLKITEQLRMLVSNLPERDQRIIVGLLHNNGSFVFPNFNMGSVESLIQSTEGYQNILETRISHFLSSSLKLPLNHIEFIAKGLLSSDFKGDVHEYIFSSIKQKIADLETDRVDNKYIKNYIEALCVIVTRIESLPEKSTALLALSELCRKYSQTISIDTDLNLLSELLEKFLDTAREIEDPALKFHCLMRVWSSRSKESLPVLAEILKETFVSARSIVDPRFKYQALITIVQALKENPKTRQCAQAVLQEAADVDPLNSSNLLECADLLQSLGDEATAKTLRSKVNP